jgi:hypothetical protein
MTNYAHSAKRPSRPSVCGARCRSYWCCVNVAPAPPGVNRHRQRSAKSFRVTRIVHPPPRSFEAGHCGSPIPLQVQRVSRLGTPRPPWLRTDRGGGRRRRIRCGYGTRRSGWRSGVRRCPSPRSTRCPRSLRLHSGHAGRWQSAAEGHPAPLPSSSSAKGSFLMLFTLVGSQRVRAVRRREPPAPAAG